MPRRWIHAIGAMIAIASCSGRRSDDRPRAEVARPSPPPPAAATAPTPAPAPAPSRVVIISEDGLRPDVISPELTPHHAALLREGEIARHAETIAKSDTLPSHASMLSGVDASAHGLSWNSLQPERGYIHVPTIFSAAHAAGLRTAMIVGKPKLRHIAVPGTVDTFVRPSYLCHGVARRAAEVIAADDTALVFVHFSDPDEYGHANGWMSPEYLTAVRHSDACLATVLAAVDTSPSAASTLVIVTADHGGHGRHHSGGHAEVDRAIPWIMRGPGIAPGVTLDADVATFDTAATTLAALGLPRLPNMLGTARATFAR